MFRIYSFALMSAGIIVGTSFAQSVTTTTVRGSGNTVIVDGTGGKGVTVLTKDLGTNNRVIVTHNGQVITPKDIVFKGKDNKFWSKSVVDAGLKETLYFSTKHKLWFSYDATKDEYRPALAFYEREAKQASAEAKKALDDAEELLRDIERLLPRD